MPRTKLHTLAELGQSAWLDYINRPMIESGQLKEWVRNGLRGMTSNPSIFHQVISGGADYDEYIVKLKEKEKTTFEIYDALTIADIRDACDIFSPVHGESQGLDGYVSLEINPKIAHDTRASILEGKRLFERVNRPNVMIKVPATPAGFPVIEELISSGINVNVTLIFSGEQYIQTVQSYFKGLEKLRTKVTDLSKVRSVASVFVSRIDSVIDKMIQEKAAALGAEQQKELNALKGKAAVANCRLILELSRELFASEKFQYLAHKGANIQRVLWGSTSTKDPAYSDVKYVEELITRPTVNTVPEKTLRAFLDHGTVQESEIMKASAIKAQDVFNTLNTYDIRITEVNAKLLDDGVKAFVDSFDALLKAIEEKAKKLCPQS